MKDFHQKMQTIDLIDNTQPLCARVCEKFGERVCPRNHWFKWEAIAAAEPRRRRTGGTVGGATRTKDQNGRSMLAFPSMRCATILSIMCYRTTWCRPFPG